MPVLQRTLERNLGPLFRFKYLGNGLSAFGVSQISGSQNDLDHEVMTNYNAGQKSAGDDNDDNAMESGSTE
jgi:hypothetical protein